MNIDFKINIFRKVCYSAAVTARSVTPFIVIVLDILFEKTLLPGDIDLYSTPIDFVIIMHSAFSVCLPRLEGHRHLQNYCFNISAAYIKFNSVQCSFKNIFKRYVIFRKFFVQVIFYKVTKVAPVSVNKKV